jgi:hypothetical protein
LTDGINVTKRIFERQIERRQEREGESEFVQKRQGNEQRGKRGAQTEILQGRRAGGRPTRGGDLENLV